MNLYQFMPIAASVPRIVATMLAVRAMNRLLNSAVHSGVESKNSFLYQMNENPVNVESFELLNENSMITNSGTNKKSSVSTRIVRLTLNCGLCFFHERFACTADSIVGVFLFILFTSHANGFPAFILRLR